MPKHTEVLLSMMKNVRTHHCDWDFNETSPDFKVAVGVEFGAPGKQGSCFGLCGTQKATPLSNSPA